MQKTLHITNGDSAVVGMQKAGLSGEFLAWRDVLHIGPVPNLESWQSLDQVRIEFLSSKLGIKKTMVEQSFKERMGVMNRLSQYEIIYLWFEHDLYDQLQLLQVLMWLAPCVELHGRIKLIVTDLYLGQASEENYHELFRYSEPLSEMHLTAAKLYWHAFTHPTPVLLPELTKSEFLPFMRPAFTRLCYEYPSIQNGLSQVQNTVLDLLSQPMNGADLFSKYQATEEAKFMGDVVFADVLTSLITADSPLVRFEQNNKVTQIWQDNMICTSLGAAVFKGQLHHSNINGIKKWIGGVHLNNEAIWCYDKKKNQFMLWRGHNEISKQDYS